MPHSLGIDFGTSGARAIVLDPALEIRSSVSLPFPAICSNWTGLWQQTLFDLLQQIPLELRHTIASIAINGTSSTVLISDATGNPLRAPLLYNDDRGSVVLEQVKSIAPPNHTVISATSSLAKLFWFNYAEGETASHRQLRNTSGRYFLHQADWLAFWLHGQIGISDYHNALKLGYDVENLRYPDWLQTPAMPFELPKVLPPGTPIAPVTAALCDRFQFPPHCQVCAGTTDSIAAVLASGVQATGEAVTSLGSTLVLKLLSNTRIEDARYGIYSHRLGERWLVGGASNTGGAVLKQFFSSEELVQLSQEIDPSQESPLDYYPLLKPGERFPMNDPQLAPRLEPRPDRPSEFLHGLLESIARIEAKGYRLLQELGATPLRYVHSAGGGAANQVWLQIRSRQLQVPVFAAARTEAAYGTARLAMQGIVN
ncbi:FGGY-family carbohydrate kinase [Leptolyngbya sp. FACHB-711]|uniref:FGGY-family carbohydrate kinase n=1 Tax=unclassified Leptolyngbya TaxID=2650499 RepID=UPI001688E1F8|nr:FGGY-family carbohydrate kinase [Leptolyngbya sp. FACHB-711]MBD1849956.1 FGGY-family carbohydrate kinase [Cyanobacteria bacterium FACHB-502]MBD2024838.1 FGGY-family carbohydrate kinase [Leptolyngbya sp. FACHB-711]